MVLEITALQSRGSVTSAARAMAELYDGSFAEVRSDCQRGMEVDHARRVWLRCCREREGLGIPTSSWQSGTTRG